MTEQTKIPLPPEGEGEKAATLIERVVRNHDFVRMSPPPIPEELLAPKARHANRYRRESDVVAEAAAAAEAAPEVVTPEVIAADEPVIRNVPAAPVRAVEFKGPRHPVDRQHLRDQGMIVPEGSVTALLEEFRIVKRQLMLGATELRQQGLGPASQRVLICSPHPGEGKTYTAINLALSIAAEKESEVLLVDADFAKPSVLSVLGLPGGPGFMDALADPHPGPGGRAVASGV